MDDTTVTLRILLRGCLLSIVLAATAAPRAGEESATALFAGGSRGGVGHHGSPYASRDARSTALCGGRRVMGPAAS